jgi:hypothetical protein
MDNEPVLPGVPKQKISKSIRIVDVIDFVKMIKGIFIQDASKHGK